MAKRKAVKKSSRTASGRPSLACLRSQIDRLDRGTLKQLNERAKLVQQIAQLTGGEEPPTAYDPAREQDILARLEQFNTGPLEDTAVRAIFREVISGSRSLRCALRVAYLGPPYSYSHLAAIRQFGQSADLAPVATIAAVFEEIQRAQADYGIVPIQNTTDGRIADTLDMFTRIPAKICGEVQLRIHHNLLGKCRRAEVVEVYSKPQALSQCRQWLAKHLPAAQTIEMTSTTMATQLAAEKPGTAAIASLQAAIHYGLDVIAPDIEDNQNNLTRFAVIGQQVPPRTGDDKTSLMFQIRHQPGALAEALAIFKRNRLNLTWIESFPIPGSNNEFLFFIELLGHQNDTKVKRAISSLSQKTVRLEILGSYAKTEPIE